MQTIGSMLLASTNPERLRDWYECAFRVGTDVDGFLRFGDVGLLIVPRDDVSPRNPEPGRFILNIHVHDAQAMARHLDALGVTWVADLEYRVPDGACFATLLDADGNYGHSIELTETYWSKRRLRQQRTKRLASRMACVTNDTLQNDAEPKGIVDGPAAN